MPWLGKMSHENTIVVSYFYETAGKTVALKFEDDAATESEVYMYVADSPKDLMEGNGQLYVFSADGISNWDDIYFSTGSVDGNDPVVPGYNAQLKLAMSNPDNIDTSEKQPNAARRQDRRDPLKPDIAVGQDKQCQDNQGGP